jgi:hypothetical protein
MFGQKRRVLETKKRIEKHRPGASRDQTGQGLGLYLFFIETGDAATQRGWA